MRSLDCFGEVVLQFLFVKHKLGSIIVVNQSDGLFFKLIVNIYPCFNVNNFFHIEQQSWMYSLYPELP